MSIDSFISNKSQIRTSNNNILKNLDNNNNLYRNASNSPHKIA